MVDPSFDPSSGHATGIPRGLLYSLIKNIPIKELKTYRRRRRRRRLDRDHPFPFSIPFPSISISIDRSRRCSVQIARNESNPRISILCPRFFSKFPPTLSLERIKNILFVFFSRVRCTRARGQRAAGTVTRDGAAALSHTLSIVGRLGRRRVHRAKTDAISARESSSFSFSLAWPT